MSNTVSDFCLRKSDEIIKETTRFPLRFKHFKQYIGLLILRGERVIDLGKKARIGQPFGRRVQLLLFKRRAERQSCRFQRSSLITTLQSPEFNAPQHQRFIHFGGGVGPARLPVRWVYV